MMEEYEENLEVVHAGATASAEAGDDVGLREGVLDLLTDAAKEIVGGGASRQALPARARTRTRLLAARPCLLESPTWTRLLEIPTVGVSSTRAWTRLTWRTSPGRPSGRTRLVT